MKHLMTYRIFESEDDDSWRRRTDDTDLKDLSYEVDDILLDISDDGFPYVQPSLINRDKIQIEIVGNDSGEITNYDEFEITKVVQDTLDRLYTHVTSRGYKCKIGLYFYRFDGFEKSYQVIFKNNKSYIVEEVGRTHSVVNRNVREVNLSEFEPDFIGITIEK